MGAGLGGGSADGAFTLKMLNEVYELKLSNDELKDFARKLGSDCAFFIENRPVFCFNKGDEFEDFTLNLKGKFVVLVNPDIHISTAEAYSGVSPKKPQIALKTALSQPISEWKKIVKNDFEEKLLLKYPTIAEVKETLYQSGAVYASMTGSGSTVYGIFEEESDLKSSFPSFAIWQGFFKV
jgi:4-diphosphocytidyl-2-C-methyl-D-erythritol kinase